MQKKYAVICARGGSKRTPGKNLSVLGGKPIIRYTVDAAKESNLFDDIIVNSEDDRILKIAEECGAAVYRRPIELSGDTVFLIDVIREIITTQKWPDETHIAILFPTVPLRTAEDIQKAYELFTLHGAQTPVVSVTPYEYPIQTALQINEYGRLIPALPSDYSRSTRHNDHKISYRATYAVIFNIAANFLVQEKLIGKDAIPFHLPPERSIDIDEPYQLHMAGLLLEEMRRHENQS